MLDDGKYKINNYNYHFKVMSHLSDPYLTDTFFSPFAFPHQFRYPVKTLSIQVKSTKEPLSIPKYL